MTMKIFKQVGLLALILFLAAQTGHATTLVVQKEISGAGADCRLLQSAIPKGLVP
jgi:hypothetical protein